MIESSYSDWISRVKAYSNAYLEQYSAYTAMDVDDWEGKAWAFYNARQEQMYSGVLFEGKKGTGKHTALSAFLNVYAGDQGAGYQVLFLDCFTLPDNQEEYGLFERHIIELANGIRDQHNNIVLVFDDIDTNPYKRNILKMLPALSGMCLSESSDLLYLVISNSLTDVSSMFMRTTYKFVFTYALPDQKKRYIEKNAPSLVSVIGVEQIIDIIGECTYSELTDIIRVLLLESAAGQKIDEEEIKNAANRYVVSNLNRTGQHPVMDVFFDRLGSALSQVPRTVAYETGMRSDNQSGNLENSSLSGSSENLYKDINPSDTLGKRRKELEEEIPHNFMIGLFGENGALEIVNSVSN